MPPVVLGSISLGWLATPIVAGVLCFVGLFFLENVFNQTVYRSVPYTLSPTVLERLERDEVATTALGPLEGRIFASAREIKQGLKTLHGFDAGDIAEVLKFAEIDAMRIDPARFGRFDRRWLTPAQMTALRSLAGRNFAHRWELAEALAAATPDWLPAEDTAANKPHNKELSRKLETVFRVFRVDE